ncbi:MAG: methylmalonyl-CoA mutase, partial [Candidatus Thermoplasmatota archaeon]|nr:methylmalonyl-CoA mutase [Candidatus Thermoplasmatota archaeon]
VIGLSLLSGAHLTLFTKVMELLKKESLENIIVLAGGIIPEEDVTKLKEIGIAEIFGPGTDTKDIVEFIKKKLKKWK